MVGEPRVGDALQSVLLHAAEICPRVEAHDVAHPAYELMRIVDVDETDEELRNVVGVLQHPVEPLLELLERDGP
ncbi:hypothetical protein [Salana multivorans]